MLHYEKLDSEIIISDHNYDPLPHLDPEGIKNTLWVVMVVLVGGIAAVIHSCTLWLLSPSYFILTATPPAKRQLDEELFWPRSRAAIVFPIVPCHSIAFRVRPPEAAAPQVVLKCFK